MNIMDIVQRISEAKRKLGKAKMDLARIKSDVVNLELDSFAVASSYVDQTGKPLYSNDKLRQRQANSLLDTNSLYSDLTLKQMLTEQTVIELDAQLGESRRLWQIYFECFKQGTLALWEEIPNGQPGTQAAAPLV